MTDVLLDRPEVRSRLHDVPRLSMAGQLVRVVGLEAEARGVRGAIGDQMWIGNANARVPAEVIAVKDDRLLLMPFGEMTGIGPGATVVNAGSKFKLRVGHGLVGRVVDALGRRIDGYEPVLGELVDFDSAVPNPMKRQRINQTLPLGVRSVDTLLTCGTGQRMGIFAGSGVGKSTLLGMMARGTQADVVVVGLVGERGREVREFLEDDLGPEGRARAVTVVATSDEPPLLRLRAAFTATRIAEWFRDQGLNVLLLVDSLTRFAMAQREVGLAAGEPPATRGYPPSVFATMPKLLERAGPGEIGTITALYTVLVEGDDLNEPVTDHARSILDGHIVLSRKLAAAGQYPTVDVLESVSRLSGKLCSPERLAMGRRLRQLMIAWEEAKDLVEIGAYVPGTNPDVDMYIARRHLIEGFLKQDVHEIADSEESWNRLAEVVA
ncbi:MAG TPA: FliI/YscN family ATPase [Acidimicrobiales bacterium]|nr:FliI/YscN family ATPase [Acidimicrobiales bacterium]